MNSKIYRIIDANLNRSREGLRVCEDITRFILDNPKLTAQLRSCRHRLSRLSQKLPLGAKQLLKSRDSQRDIGKYLVSAKRKNKQVREVFTANIRRSQESLRVLEEFSKIMAKKTTADFERIRYKLYTLEQKALLCL